MIYPLFLIEALQEGFIGILLTLDTLIYSLISSSFKVFMAIAGARLLSSDAYFEIANKVYVIVGVLMLFVLSYAILKGIVDPDNASKGDFGPKMIKNVVIAVIGLAISPVIFNLMYQAQGLMLENDVLGKIFFRIDNTEQVNISGNVDLGSESVNINSTVNPDEYVKTIGGAVTAVNLWQAFFFPAPDSGKEAKDIVASADDYFLSAAGNGLLCAGLVTGSILINGIPVVGQVLSLLGAGASVFACGAMIVDISAGAEAAGALDGKDISLEEAYAYASAGEGFGIFTVFLSNYVDDGEISYYFGISTIAGAFALYAFVSFSIDMGIRAAKLAYLQIIAPIPLVMQVIPKYKKSFDNYIGLVVSTFMEVFIRISVVYVVVYIICHLTDLFSSASLWASDSLNAAERLFALAFLILGLIAFCRKAPEFITNSLGLKKGDMHLGIGKKLAEGGFYAGKSIVGGGITAGVRNWRADKDKGFKQKALSAVAGFGSGAMRATALNFGPGHKPADTWRQSKDIAENAAQGANDARDKRDAREKRNAAAMASLKEAREAQRTALANFTAAENALATAQASGDQAAIAAAQAALTASKTKLDSADKAVSDAMKEAAATTAIGDLAVKTGRRIDAWSTGTVSTKDEEAAVKFGDSLDALKGKLREEAYKKDNMSPNGAGTLKQEYERLKAQPIREYVEGWDEQSYNAEYRRRLAELNRVRNDADIQSGLSAVNAARANHTAALAEISRLRDAGVAENDARLVTARNNLTAAQATLESQRNSLKTLVQTKGTVASLVDDTGNLVLDMSDIKVNERQAREERAKQVEALRIAMEAAADDWVNKKAMEQGSNTNRDIQLFLSENAAYINQHGTDKIVVGYDGENPIYKSIADVISEGFGTEAAKNGKFVIDDKTKELFANQTAFEIEIAGHGKVMYKLEGSDYVPVDENGARINDATLQTYSAANIFEEIREGITRGKIKGASSKSAISKAADAGKSASTYTKTHELADKRNRQRLEQENKGGKK